MLDIGEQEFLMLLLVIQAKRNQVSLRLVGLTSGIVWTTVSSGCRSQISVSDCSRILR
jgi:hypothetical protein